MKTSIRSTRFTFGMVLFLVIILLLSVSSAFYLNRLSAKTKAILKENHVSVVYARVMSESLSGINQGVFKSVLTDRLPDTSSFNSQFRSFNSSLISEKNNITEVGEEELASAIESNYNEYRDSVLKYIKSPDPVILVSHLQTKFDTLYKQLMLLSRMNETAIEKKTDEAKASAKRFTLQMTFIGSICFLIAYGFTFIFTSYFNERFYRLYNEIQELEAGNFSMTLKPDGNDELTDIALVINEMVGRIKEKEQKKHVTLQNDTVNGLDLNDIRELKEFLLRMKSIEVQAREIITRFENK